MRYAVIREGVCVNIVVSDAEFAGQMGLVPLPDGFGVGDFYEKGMWRRA